MSDTAKQYLAAIERRGRCPQKQQTKNMNTHTHTPGPWLANDDGLVWSDHNSLGKQNVIGAFTQADAALIASAPELLELCKTVLRRLDQEHGERIAKGESRPSFICGAMRGDLRAAIAKAKGGAK